MSSSPCSIAIQVEADRQVLLRQSEERFRMLFEDAPNGILIINGSGSILMANTIVYQMLGYTPEEVLGRSPLDFVAPEDLVQRPPRALEEIKLLGSVKRERVLVHKKRLPLEHDYQQ